MSKRNITTQEQTINAGAPVGTFETRMQALRAHRLAATSDDMGKVLGQGKKASCFEFTAAVNATIDAWGIDTSAIFASDRNPKVIKRFIQFVHGVNAKDYKAVDKATAIIIYALHLGGDSDLTVDALHYFGAGLKTGKISPETRGVSRQTLGRILGSVGISTIPTQCSRTVGRNGFLQLAGATVGEPGKINQKVKLNASHPMVIAFLDTMNKATQAQISEMVGDDA